MLIMVVFYSDFFLVVQSLPLYMKLILPPVSSDKYKFLIRPCLCQELYVKYHCTLRYYLLSFQRLERVFSDTNNLITTELYNYVSPNRMIYFSAMSLDLFFSFVALLCFINGIFFVLRTDSFHSKFIFNNRTTEQYDYNRLFSTSYL